VRKTLVTGSEGFIGKQTKILLLEQGLDVYTLDVKGEGAKHQKADINSFEAREFVLRLKPEVIIHLAAQVDVQLSVSDPLSDMKTNVFGTLSILSAGIQSGVKEFIFVGSGGAIYSSDNVLPVNENGEVLPKSPYGVSKLAAENYVRVLSELNEIGWTSLALSNCYGSVYSYPKGVIYEFYRKITSGESAVINGAAVTRDFIHVNDVAAAIYSAVGNPTNSRVNISSNNEISLLDLYHKICTTLKADIQPKVLPAREGDVIRSKLDNTRAFERLKWSPKITLDEGLRMCLSKAEIQ
jgi:UDP-glucose 4-epimerase